MVIVKINYYSFWFVNQSNNEETAVAFAHAYALPYCTKKNFFFAQMGISMTNYQLTLIARKFEFL
jgi:hypothetical protein